MHIDYYSIGQDWQFISGSLIVRCLPSITSEGAGSALHGSSHILVYLCICVNW